MGKKKRVETVEVVESETLEESGESTNDYLPLKLTTQQFDHMTDDEVNNRIHFMSSERKIALEQGIDSRPWDNEVSYAIRELELREIGRALHQQYMSVIHEEERLFAQQESMLQYVDFDNFKPKREQRDQDE